MDEFFPSQVAASPLRSASPHEMVVVAQLVEPRVVIPVVAGSSPVVHPIFLLGFTK